MFPTRRSLARLLVSAALCSSLGVAAWAALPEQTPKTAQTAPETLLPDDREAAFMQSPAIQGGGVALPSAQPEKPSALAVGAPIPLHPAPAQTMVPAETAKPVAPDVPTSIAKPVVEEPLPDVDPDTAGLLSPSNGGLGTALWQGTPRAFVERLLPELNLPTASPTLNNLARRLLLSTAVLPEGPATPEKNLMAMRLEKLVALGQADDAWRLARRAKFDRFDDPTQRLVAENAIAGTLSADVCERVPALMAARKDDEKAGSQWQKALIVCQFIAKDLPAAQTGLDVMRDGKDPDALFLSIASRNVIAEGKQLPHQLTPLKPLTLALLRQTNLPLPKDLYAKPDASLIPSLLAAKAVNEETRLGLAERAAAKGILSPADLGAVYKSVAFTPQDVLVPDNASASGAPQRALYYQASLQDNAARRATDFQKIAQTVDMPALEGSLGALLAEGVAGLTPTPDQASFAPTAARIMTLAGKPEQALQWLKLAREAGAQKPEIANALLLDWPLFVLSGLVPDADYGAGLKAWLDERLKESDRVPLRVQREKAGNVLLMLSAAGYALPEEALTRVIDGTDGKKTQGFSPVLFERLRQAGQTNRRGEAVMLSVLLAGGASGEVSLSVIAEAVRALRLTGLAGDAQALARETVVSVLAGG